MGNCQSCQSSSDDGESKRPVQAIAQRPAQHFAPVVVQLPSAMAASAQKPLPPPTNKPLLRYLEQSHDMIFAANRAWIEAKLREDPAYFVKLSSPQHPEYL